VTAPDPGAGPGPGPGPAPALGAWLRQAHPGAPVELVTAAGAVPLSAAQWLGLVEDGVRFYAPQLRAALVAQPGPG
jgi:hypothetical protein